MRSGEDEDEAPSKLPRAVVALGWVSLLTDAASDMIYPLIPAFLISIGGGAAALGWIEGLAEGTAALIKLAAGRASDRQGASRKTLVALGYGVSTIARPFYALATAPAHAVLIRIVDRVGKGLRGPPRDAMIAGAVSSNQRGRAFGFHRMMDNFGAVVGSLLAFALLRFGGLSLRSVFIASIVPGALAVLVVLLFVRDPSRARDPRGDASSSSSAARSQAPSAPPSSPPQRSRLSSGARRYLVALALFSLAGAGDLFLLRRLKDLGLDDALAPIAWVSLQLAKGLLNVPGGVASDKLGRRRVLAIAWALYAVTYVGFALVPSWPAAWALLGLYALHYGLAEGGQRALLAEYAPQEVRGRAFGIQLAVEGVAILLANVVFGLVYDKFSAQAAFSGAGAVALLAAMTLVLFVPAPPASSTSSA